MPAVNGYQGLSAARDNARIASSGVGSTGVPTDRSTIPPGCASAVALAAAIVSQGKSGSSEANLVRRAGTPVNTAQRSLVVLLRGQAFDQRVIFIDHTELGGSAR